MIGSAKTNLGHLEAAAGMVGLLKVVAALQHDELPPHRTLERPNPLIGWGAVPLAVVSKTTPWPRGRRPRRAGISAFAFQGSNAHVVLEEAPARTTRTAARAVARPQLLVVSAKNDESLRKNVHRYASYLRATDADFVDICYTALVHRTHFSE